MNIAFDIHGTLDLHKKLRDFLWILERFQHVTSNLRIYIISGRPKEQIKERLNKLNLPQKVTVISVVDYLKSKKVSMSQDKNEDWWCNDYFWWKSKGEICKEYEIDILIDNEIKYKEFMPKETIFLKVE